MKKIILFLVFGMLFFSLASSFEAVSYREPNIIDIDPQEKTGLEDSLCSLNKIDAIDSSECQAYEYIIISGPFKGILDFNLKNDGGIWINEGKGRFYYVPNGGINGSDYFYYLLKNKSSGQNSTIGLISFGINNIAPVALSDKFVYNSTEGILGGSVSLNDFDENNDDLFAILTRNVSFGSLSFLENGSFNYSTAKKSGVDFFKYYQTDLHMDSKEVYSILIIDNNNSAPIAREDEYFLLNSSFNLSLNSTEGFLANDEDIDGDILLALLVENVKNGTLYFYENGSFEYYPNKGFVGIDSFSYYSTDLDKNSSVVSVKIYVNTTKLPPIVPGGVVAAGGGGGAGGGGYCSTEWTCTEWSTCINGTQTRNCSYPINFCAPTTPKPAEIRNCTIELTPPTIPLSNQTTQNQTRGRNFLTGLVVGAGDFFSNPLNSIITIVIVLAVLGGAFWLVKKRKESSLKNNGTNKKPVKKVQKREEKEED